MFKVFPCSLSSCFIIPRSIVITSLGENGAGLRASRAFRCLFCHFSLLFLLVSGIGCRFVIVVLPGLFYYPFLYE